MDRCPVIIDRCPETIDRCPVTHIGTYIELHMTWSLGTNSWLYIVEALPLCSVICPISDQSYKHSTIVNLLTGKCAKLRLWSHSLLSKDIYKIYRWLVVGQSYEPGKQTRN